MYTAKITKSHLVLSTEQEPDRVIHLVRTGHSSKNGRRLWYIFYEDAYRMEPHTSGIETITEEEIERRYGIVIPQGDAEYLTDEGKKAKLLDNGVKLLIANIDAHRHNIRHVENEAGFSPQQKERLTANEHAGLSVNAELLRVLTEQQN